LADKTHGATTFRIVSDREIEMTRVFDAPRELVFEAYSKPEHIPHWWGPRSVTTIVETMDVRPGGAWRFIQRDQDGVEYAFYGEYREVVPPERIVSTFEFEGFPGLVMVDTLTLRDVDGKTTLTVNSRFASREERDRMVESGLEDGAREMWDRLAEHLETLRQRVGG
jgi:uncharacterized protein YndB with AHSA1/START domain